jgi:enoyl-CoA hydratase
VGLAREAVRIAFAEPLEAGLREERRLFALAVASEDAQEGMDAFVNRRRPVWRHDR